MKNSLNIYNQMFTISDCEIMERMAAWVISVLAPLIDTENAMKMGDGTGLSQCV